MRTPDHSPVVPDSLQMKPVVRGWVGRFELLTELGWVRLDALYRNDLLSGEVPFEGRAVHANMFPARDVVWGQWRVNPSTFPRVASVNPVNGEVLFVRPTRFQFWLVEDEEKLVTVKTRGIDLTSSRHADHLVLPRYGRGWKFQTGDDVVRAGRTGAVAQFRYMNKFSHDLYGWFDPATVMEGDRALAAADGSRISGVVGSSLRADVSNPILVRAEKAVAWLRADRHPDVSMDAGGVRVFNLHVPPFHTVVVRKGRDTDDPRERWIGSPTVVGDGSDKSVIRHLQVAGAKAGSSYSVLRPDWKELTGAGVDLSEDVVDDQFSVGYRPVDVNGVV